MPANSDNKIKIFDTADIDNYLNIINIFFTDDLNQFITKKYNGLTNVLIIDENVFNLYLNSKLINEFNQNNIIKIKAEEQNKTLSCAYKIFNKLIELKADKKSHILAIGGGITCDIAAFVAATFYRGIPITLIPSTLLAQADAAIGGKNAVNFNNIKNVIGTIRQVDSIVIDLNFLHTLPQENLKDGFAEIIKISLIKDEALFDELENFNISYPLFINKQLETIIKKAIYNKLKIVTIDEFENGLRRLLNFGHSLAHSIEAVYGISHGKAVAIGMKYASAISAKKYQLKTNELNRILSILKKYDFNTELEINIEDIFKFLLYDKKKESDYINFIILKKIGEAQQIKILFNDLKKEINALHYN